MCWESAEQDVLYRGRPLLGGHSSSFFFTCFVLFLLFPSCFLPPSMHCLFSEAGGEQAVPLGPASLPGRVMYEWLALTSLQPRRHGSSALPGLLFLIFSFIIPHSFY